MQKHLSFSVMLFLLFGIFFQSACDNQKSTHTASEEKDIPVNFFAVEPIPVTDQSASEHSPVASTEPARLSIQKGNYFSYALPAGWRIGENGQYALTLTAPDNKAITLMVGNSGLMPDYSPQQFIYDKMMAIRPEGLSIGEGRQAKPVTGFQYAWAYPVSYAVNGQPCQGLATCHVSPYYGGAVMAMTAALSEASQWPGYSNWLPLVAEQISAHNGAAFGMRGMMQQNLSNSTAYAEAARQYRDWSQKNWQQVTDDRNKVNDRQQREFRENLGGVQSYVNPYDDKRAVELSTQYKYYWIDQQGHVLGTNVPDANPNTGSTQDWRPMKQQN